MNRRFRRQSTSVAGYLCYLKPGALAQLRDQKINAKTHHRSPDFQISQSPSRSVNPTGSGQQQDGSGTVSVGDGELPFFPVRFYGPRCLKRKKLMAARSVLVSEPANASGSVNDALVNDFVVALAH